MCSWPSICSSQENVELYELFAPLWISSFANIFSHSVDCLFNLFMTSFAVQKLLILIKSHLFLFLFPLLQELNPKNIAAIYAQECSACVFLLSFTLFGLMSRSLICFEFIFVYGIRECSNFILLHVAVHFHFFPASLIEETVHLFIVYSCLLCHQLDHHRCLCLSLDCLSYFIDLYLYFCASTMLF